MKSGATQTANSEVCLSGFLPFPGLTGLLQAEWRQLEQGIWQDKAETGRLFVDWLIEAH